MDNTAGFAIINLRDILERPDGTALAEKIVSSFSCQYNADVDDFIHNKAIEFSKQNISSTYLVFASYKKEMLLVGYFSIANKSIHIDTNRSKLSREIRKKLRVYGSTYDVANANIIEISCFLIGQLGKNYACGIDDLITGEELLAEACAIVRKLQRWSSGKFVYLECENTDRLIKFYEDNDFVKFGVRNFTIKEQKEHYPKQLVRLIKYLHNE